MQSRGYAYQLRTYRAAERAYNRDYTPQAMDVYSLRLKSIDAGPGDEDQKERERAAAHRQWESFMQRPMPPVEIPF